MNDYQKFDRYKENWYAFCIAIETNKSSVRALEDMGFTQGDESENRGFCQKWNLENAKWNKIPAEWLRECKLNGVSQKEMAEIMGCSPSTIVVACKKYGIKKEKK